MPRSTLRVPECAIPRPGHCMWSIRGHLPLRRCTASMPRSFAGRCAIWRCRRPASTMCCTMFSSSFIVGWGTTTAAVRCARGCMEWRGGWHFTIAAAGSVESDGSITLLSRLGMPSPTMYWRARKPRSGSRRLSQRYPSTNGRYSFCRRSKGCQPRRSLRRPGRNSTRSTLGYGLLAAGSSERWLSGRKGEHCDEKAEF